MKTLNLNGIEVLSNRQLACVKGGGEEGIPTPIIIIETGVAVPSGASSASLNAVNTLIAVKTTSTPCC